MTLTEVAAKNRAAQKELDKLRDVLLYPLVDAIISDFEADPDFKMRERIEELMADFADAERLDGRVQHASRRLREILEGK